MYDDAKLTYIVIAILVVLLGGVAYFLQSDGLKSTKSEEVTTEKSTNVDMTKNTLIKSKMNTTSTTTNIKNSTTTKEDITNMISSTSTATTIPKEVKGAIISTNFGDIEIVFDESKIKTVTNFISLVTTHFYDSVKFHRVIKDFMIQTGDPLSKDIMQKNLWGTGGPGYKFADELTGDEKYTQGTVAMANSGPNTNGSQFFIVTAYPDVELPPNYTIFGHVVNGLDTALKIQNVATEGKGTIDRPLENIIIKNIVLK